MRTKKIIILSFLVMIVSVRSEAAFTIKPYLQIGNQTSATPRITKRITVCWDSDTVSTGRVYYGLEFDSLDQWVDDPLSSTRHEVEITGLEPYTLYYYKVVAGADQGPLSYFRTAPRDPHKPFTFGIVGDTRSGHANHQMVIDMMRSWAPDFYVHSGDLVNSGGYMNQWLIFFSIETPLMQFAPMAPAIGNHELIGGLLYPDIFALPVNLHPTKHYYSWDYGNVHFLNLRTEYNTAALWNQQNSQIMTDLFEAAMSYPNPRFIVVVLHRPAYSNGLVHGGDENYPYSTTWGPLFELAGVAMVIQGHDHVYERFEPIDNREGLGDPPGDPDVIRRGVTYVTSGAGGAPFAGIRPVPGTGGGGTPPLDSLVAETGIYEAGLAEVQGGRMDVTFYNAQDYSILDQFAIIRNEKPTADAGGDFMAVIRTEVRLDGSGSLDLEGDHLKFSWRQVSGPEVSLEKPQSMRPSFIPDLPGVYTFALTVNDGIDKSRDTVSIAVSSASGGHHNNDRFFLCGQISSKGGSQNLTNLFYLLIPLFPWLAVRIRRIKQDIPG